MNPSPVRIVFLGSYSWSVLLLSAIERAPGVRVTRILTTADRLQDGKRIPFRTPVAQWCLEQGAADRLVTPATLDDDGLTRDLTGEKAHCALAVAYPKRIPASFCDLFPHGGLNLHPSLLPRWRGPDPVRRAMLAKDPHVGVSLHQLAHAFDAGDLLWQTAIAPDEGDTCQSVLQRLGEIAATALPGVLADYVAGRIHPCPQTGETTYAAPIEESERWVRPEMTLAEANRLIAVLHPYKPALWLAAGAVYEFAGPIAREAGPRTMAVELADGAFHAPLAVRDAKGAPNDAGSGSTRDA